MADPVFVDEVTPLNAVNMNKLQTRDEKGAVGGYPSLDGTGKVPAAQLPAGGGGGATDISYEGTHVPASSHDDGDIVIKDGILYLAQRTTTQNPDPTLWGAVGPAPTTRQGELGYAEFTSPVSVTATTEASAQTLVTAPAVVCDGLTPLLVEFWAQALVSPATANSYVQLWLFMDGVSLGLLGTVLTPAASNAGAPPRVARRLTPSAGTHTFSVRAAVLSGTGTVNVGPGGAGQQMPGAIRISLASPAIIPTPGHLVPVSYATTLPTGPVDGQEAILVDSVTNPTFQWRFRWNAGSSSAYKWEFVGGSSWSVYIATSQTVTGDNTWRDPATVGPSITVPRAGDYEVIGSVGNVYNSGAASMSVGVSIGATAADWTAGFYEGTAGQVVSPMFQGVYLGLAASSALRLRYLASAGTFTVRGRRLSVLPVRVA